MTKTIDEKLKDLDEKEADLKALLPKKLQEIEEERQQLKAEKQQESAQQKIYATYAEKFKAFGLEFLYDYNEISIKPFDSEQDEFITFIYLDRKETSTDVLNTFLEHLELGRRIEKQTVFKLSNFVNNLTFIYKDGDDDYFLTVSDGCLCHLNITKANHKDANSYRKTLNNGLTIVVESQGYDDFNVSWEYETVTSIGELISEIEKGMLLLHHA